jgi:hypothetical protein
MSHGNERLAHRGVDMTSEQFLETVLRDQLKNSQNGELRHVEACAIMTGRRLLKEPAARAYLGNMSHATLWELRQSGQIPTLRVGKSIYFDRADLDAFIDTIREEPA